jgi:DnaJ-class molecular chaperone
MARPCSHCGGAGRVITDPCPDCRGAGIVNTEGTLAVKVPAGVDTGTRLRMSGEGEASDTGAQPGDLYVVLHVKEHALFQREETDILCEVPVSFVEAALGASIEVPTLEGKVKVKIPAATQSGKVLGLKERESRSSMDTVEGPTRAHRGGDSRQLTREQKRCSRSLPRSLARHLSPRQELQSARAVRQRAQRARAHPW